MAFTYSLTCKGEMLVNVLAPGLLSLVTWFAGELTKSQDNKATVEDAVTCAIKVAAYKISKARFTEY